MFFFFFFLKTLLLFALGFPPTSPHQPRYQHTHVADNQKSRQHAHGMEIKQ